MLATKQAAADAFMFLFGLAFAGGFASSQAATPITLAGSGMGALGGLIGGFLLVYTVPRMSIIQRLLALVLSGTLGFAFAPISSIALALMLEGWILPNDLWVRIPVGAAIGALTPWVYKLFTRLIRVAENNPDAIIEGIVKIRRALPSIHFNKKDD